MSSKKLSRKAMGTLYEITHVLQRTSPLHAQYNIVAKIGRPLVVSWSRRIVEAPSMLSKIQLSSSLVFDHFPAERSSGREQAVA